MDGYIDRYTVGHKDGIIFSPQCHGIFLAVGDI